MPAVLQESHGITLLFQGEECVLDENCLAGEKCCKGLCSTIQCVNDKSCDDGLENTLDICNNDNSCEASCTHAEIPLACETECESDEDCDDGRDETEDACNNEGQCNSYCTNTEKQGDEQAKKHVKAIASIKVLSGEHHEYLLNVLDQNNLAVESQGAFDQAFLEGKKDLEMQINIGNLKSLFLEGVVLDNNTEILEIEFLPDTANEKGGVVKKPFMFSSKKEFLNGIIYLTAPSESNAVLKCEEWNSEKNRCSEEWKVEKTFKNPEEIELYVYPEGNVFGFAEINIITVQSYPTVGGQWVVEFTTLGKADLEIEAVQGTSWSNETEDEDLKFIEIKCGETSIQSEWIDETAIIRDFECSETGSETSKVLTKGKHVLEFKFGDDVKHAFNQAGQDFNIQRGTLIISSGSLTGTLTEGVDFFECEGECFIKHVSTRHSGLGRTSGGGNQNFDDFETYISNDAGLSAQGGTITFTRHGTTNNDRVTWEIWDYIGPSNGDNEMAVLDTGSCTFGSASATCDGSSASGVTDDSDIVVFVTGHANPDTARSNGQMCWVTSEWVSASDVPRFTRGETGNECKVSYAVVEYTGSNWNVERNEHTFTSSATQSETITSVGDISKAFFHTQQRNAGGNSYDGLVQAGSEVELTAATTLTFRLPLLTTNWGSNMNAVTWVIWNTQSVGKVMKVSHYNPTDQVNATGSEEENWQPTITALNYSVSETSITGMTTQSDGTGVAFPRSYLGAMLTNSTTVDFWQSDAGQEQEYSFQVVQWPTAPRPLNLDVNTWKVEDNDLGQALPSFSYASDGNLTIDFNVFDWDNFRITADINYSTSNTQGTGTTIFQDLNLVSGACADLDWDDEPSTCSFDWNISGIADNNYFILIEINNGLNTNFDASAQSFRVNPVGGVDLSFAMLLPSSGCTEGKGSTDAGTDCEKCYFETTDLSGAADETQVACEGQTGGTPFFHFDNQSSTSTSLDWEMNIDTALPASLKLKVSQVSGGWEATCSGTPATGCVDVGTSLVEIETGVTMAGDADAWAWADFVSAIVGTTDKTLTHTSSES